MFHNNQTLNINLFSVLKLVPSGNNLVINPIYNTISVQAWPTEENMISCWVFLAASAVTDNEQVYCG